MANLLAVKSHPLNGENSKSMKIFEEFLKAYQESHPKDNIEIVDLYKEDFPEIDLDIMTVWNHLQAGKEFNDLSNSQKIKVFRFNQSTEQFLKSDKVVVANGLWNLNIPTRLKAWFDSINVAGKTFKYTAQGPVGLVEGKKVLHIQANGGVCNGQDLSSQYVKTIFNFIGVSDLQQVFIEGADYDPSKSENIVNSAIEKAVLTSEKF
ncbi:FMN-dependent NADH-azoreductase [Floricoccus penangensis]|uniref:FMN dependent NADH:quinone oxidoreductase n=1 Tax=Floricoccus penangensis TaxID=1859475 RepID=A0A9Q5JFP9_9LACT|nr:FMN-dependent NADH-azoreductase [Floricoccus penangensis]OFI46107.1 FMN-dependent NADH-azoreductase [Floricoccus penangensis]